MCFLVKHKQNIFTVDNQFIEDVPVVLSGFPSCLSILLYEQCRVFLLLDVS